MKKNKKNEEQDVKQELMPLKYIIQPYPITAMQANLSQRQIHILVAMMQQLQHDIKNFIGNKKKTGQLSLFDATNTDYVTIEIKYSDVCDRPDCYRDVERVAETFMDVVFRYEDTEEHEIMLKHFVDNVTFSTKGSKRNSIRFTFTKEQAVQVFNLTMFSKYIKSSVLNINSKYTSRLYMFFSTFRGTEKAGTGVFHCYTRYEALRRMLGCDENVNGEWKAVNNQEYRFFKKNVLKVAMDEMKAMSEKGLCDFWFEYKELPKGFKGKPESFDFIIYLNDIGKTESRKTDAAKVEMDLREVLKGELKLTDRECSRLLDGVELDDMPYLRERAMQIAEAIRKKGDAIKEAKAYAKKSMSEAIKDLADKRQTEQAQATPAPASEQQETPKVVKLYSEEDAKLFQQVKDITFDIATDKSINAWLPEIHLIEVTENAVIIEMPTKAFYETFVEMFGDGFISRLRKYFSRKVKVNFVNKF